MSKKGAPNLKILRAKLGMPEPATKRRYKDTLSPKHKSCLMRANAKGLEFNLLESDFEELEDAHCVYCGDSATGFDRIDSSKGYVRHNVQPCCGRCNWMKREMSDSAYRLHIAKTYAHLWPE